MRPQMVWALISVSRWPTSALKGAEIGGQDAGDALSEHLLSPEFKRGWF